MDEDLKMLGTLPTLDVTPDESRALLRRARAAQEQPRATMPFISRFLVPAGLACTAVLYLQWAVQVATH